MTALMGQVDALLRMLIDADVVTVHDGLLPYDYAMRLDGEPPAALAEALLLEPDPEHDGVWLVSEERFGADPATGRRVAEPDDATAERLLRLLLLAADAAQLTPLCATCLGPLVPTSGGGHTHLGPTGVDARARALDADHPPIPYDTDDED